MNRLSISFVAVLATLVLAGNCRSQEGMISTVDASRAGLEVEWTTQVDVSARGGKIVDIQLNVNENRSRTFFAIQYGSRRETISEFDIGPFGVPFGTNPSLASMDRALRQQIELRIRNTLSDKEISEELLIDESKVAQVRQEIVDRVAEAEQAAKNRQEKLIAQLNLQGRDVEVTMEKLTLPESSIYLTTTTGYVRAIDADTGMTRWSNSVGDRGYPTIGLGAGNDHVAVVNGSTLYCLEAQTGKLLWSKRCRGSVGSSPMVSDKLIFVPLVNGRLEAFSIEKNGVGSSSFVSIGRAHSRPLITKESVCWATDRGYFTVASNESVGSPHYRLRADAPIVAPGTSNGETLFVGSIDGFAYAIDEVKGSLLWEFSTGQRLMHSPIPLGRYVYLITNENMMFKLFADSGIVAPGWSSPIPRIKRFIAAGKDKIYVQNNVGQIVAISQANGSVLSRVSSLSTELVLENYQTDRLYVGNGSGSLQCLREPSSVVPMFHADEVIDVADDAPANPAPDAGQPAEKDPFATFGDDEKTKPKNDPFGDGAPAGKKEEKKEEKKKDPKDPFGNSNDPFKG